MLIVIYTVNTSKKQKYTLVVKSMHYSTLIFLTDMEAHFLWQRIQKAVQCIKQSWPDCDGLMDLTQLVSCFHKIYICNCQIQLFVISVYLWIIFQYSKGGVLLNGGVAMVTATHSSPPPPAFAHRSLFRIIPGIAAHSSLITQRVSSPRTNKAH